MSIFTEEAERRAGDRKLTPLERHNAQCGTEFCILHKAAPQMVEALRRVVAQDDRVIGHDVLVAEVTIDACRAALRAAGVE